MDLIFGNQDLTSEKKQYTDFIQYGAEKNESICEFMFIHVMQQEILVSRQVRHKLGHLYAHNQWMKYKKEKYSDRYLSNFGQVDEYMAT